MKGYWFGQLELFSNFNRPLHLISFRIQGDFGFRVCFVHRCIGTALNKSLQSCWDSLSFVWSLSAILRKAETSTCTSSYWTMCIVQFDSKTTTKRATKTTATNNDNRENDNNNTSCLKWVAFEIQSKQFFISGPTFNEK